jgi:hypothetical protein
MKWVPSMGWEDGRRWELEKDGQVLGRVFRPNYTKFTESWSLHDKKTSTCDSMIEAAKALLTHLKDAGLL